MSNEELREGNKLIAEFMEFDIGANTKWIEDEDYPKRRKIEVNGTVEDLIYHESWNALIPVIRKIKDYLKEMPTRPTKNHVCDGDMIEFDIQCHLMTLNIEGVWKEVIEFIKWHNQSNPISNHHQAEPAK